MTNIVRDPYGNPLRSVNKERFMSEYRQGYVVGLFMGVSVAAFITAWVLS